MTEPVVVTISHRLGKEEALRRLKNGLTNLPASLGPAFRIVDQTWSDDELDFRVVALTQSIGGTIKVADDYVRLQLNLPWLLAKLAARAQTLIQREGRLMLERK